MLIPSPNWPEQLVAAKTCPTLPSVESLLLKCENHTSCCLTWKESLPRAAIARVLLQLRAAAEGPEEKLRVEGEGKAHTQWGRESSNFVMPKQEKGPSFVVLLLRKEGKCYWGWGCCPEPQQVSKQKQVRGRQPGSLVPPPSPS